jgi:putative FmdB family regulatory protein
MAQYEYMCQVCTQVTIVVRPMTEELDFEPYCDNCTIPMKRVWAAAAIHFKGTGWGGDK